MTVSSPFSGQRSGGWLLVLFLIGLGVRLAVASYLNAVDSYTFDQTGYLEFNEARGDDREYEGRGWNFVSGGNFWALPSGDGNGPPGYAILIGLVYAVAGRELSVLLWMNAALGGVTAALTYVLGRKVADHRVGLLAGLFVSVDPLLLYWSTRIMAETLTVFLAIALLVAAAHMSESTRHVRSAMLYGLLAAAAILVRNQLIAVVGATGVWLLATGGRMRIRGLAYAATVCCAVVLFVTALGIAKRPAGTVNQIDQLFDGDWLSARSYVDLTLERAVYERQGLTMQERQSITDQAVQYVIETPAWKVVIWNWIERIRVFWRMMPGTGSTLDRTVYFGSSALLFALSLLGLLEMWTSMPRQRAVQGLNGLLLLTCVSVVVLHVLLISKSRYRLPLHPILWIWASSFLVAIAQRIHLVPAVEESRSFP